MKTSGAMKRPSQRAHPRFALEIDCSVRIGEQTIPARTRNVSRGGVAITAESALSVGAGVTISLALVFALPETRGDEVAMSEPLPLQGRVVWCSPVATTTGAGYQLGVMFVGMRHDERRYVDMFLRYLRE
jgi:Tfp pilus assembly protein PilZ